jgi:hypothetical protein
MTDPTREEAADDLREQAASCRRLARKARTSAGTRALTTLADQPWMRIATRLESALLPNISYRVCGPEERDEAFAWATGRAAA